MKHAIEISGKYRYIIFCLCIQDRPASKRFWETWPDTLVEDETKLLSWMKYFQISFFYHKKATVHSAVLKVGY